MSWLGVGSHFEPTPKLHPTPPYLHPMVVFFRCVKAVDFLHPAFVSSGFLRKEKAPDPCESGDGDEDVMLSGHLFSWDNLAKSLCSTSGSLRTSSLFVSFPQLLHDDWLSTVGW